MRRTQRTQFMHAAALVLACALSAVPVFAEGEAGKKVEPTSPPHVGAVSDTTSILDRNHHLGPGDTVEIIVDGYPQFSRTVKLFADGSFDFPVLETVQAIGLTTKELRELVMEGMRKELRRPIVYVNLTSIYVPPPPPPMEVKIPKISAYGAVGRKGQIDLPQPRPFRQIIQELGTTERADLTNIRIRYPDGSARTVDVSDFATKGEFKDDILIKGGEEIIVVERPEVQRPEPIRVQVLGHINKSGFVSFEGSAPLLEVLDKAGGTKTGAAMDHIKVVNGNDVRYVDLEKYVQGDVSANYFCRNGDVITVEEKPMKVIVFGEVARPGDVAVDEGESLMKVILSAGINQNADKGRVELIRELKNGKVERKTINLTSIERQKKTDIVLMRGDVLFVPSKNRKKTIVDFLSAIVTPIWLVRSIAPAGL